MINTFLVAHSYGELENFFSINLNTNKKFYLVIYKKKIYQRLFKDTIYKSIIKKKNIKIFFFNSFLKRTIYSLFIILFSKKIYISDSLPIIYSKFFYIVSKFFFKKRILITHSTTPLAGLSVNYKPRNFTRDKNCLYLVNNKFEYEIFKQIGYNKVKLIENPYKNKKYISLCKQVNFKIKNYTLVYSSGHHDTIFNKFMRERQYRIFFRQYRKVFKDKQVIIKPHPGESIYEIKKILRQLKERNVEISENNTLLLTLNASEKIAFLN